MPLICLLFITFVLIGVNFGLIESNYIQLLRFGVYPTFENGKSTKHFSLHMTETKRSLKDPEHRRCNNMAMYTMDSQLPPTLSFG